MKRLDQPLEMTLVGLHRREECAHYAKCLEEASTLLWPSFSCRECPLYCFGGNPIASYERSASPLAWDL